MSIRDPKPRTVTQAAFEMAKKRYTVRIFPEFETTEVVYRGVAHCLWEADNTVLVVVIPGERQAHWLREWIRHYDIMEEMTN